MAKLLFITIALVGLIGAVCLAQTADQQPSLGGLGGLFGGILGGSSANGQSSSLSNNVQQQDGGITSWLTNLPRRGYDMLSKLMTSYRNFLPGGRDSQQRIPIDASDSSLSSDLQLARPTGGQQIPLGSGSNDDNFGVQHNQFGNHHPEIDTSRSNVMDIRIENGRIVPQQPAGSQTTIFDTNTNNNARFGQLQQPAGSISSMTDVNNSNGPLGPQQNQGSLTNLIGINNNNGGLEQQHAIGSLTNLVDINNNNGRFGQLQPQQQQSALSPNGRLEPQQATGSLTNLVDINNNRFGQLQQNPGSPASMLDIGSGNGRLGSQQDPGRPTNMVDTNINNALLVPQQSAGNPTNLLDNSGSNNGRFDPQLSNDIELEIIETVKPQ